MYVYHVKNISIDVSQLISLLKCKEAIEYCARVEDEKIFDLILKKWALISEIVTVLKVPFEATNVTQIATLTLSDFYFCWKKMCSQLIKLINTTERSSGFAAILLGKIEIRQKYLLDEPAMITAVYMDPRFNFELDGNDIAIQIAKLTLANIYDRLMQVKQMNRANLSVNE